MAFSRLIIAFRYVGIWMGIRQMGPLVGGAISLAINVNTAHTGKVSYNTYLGLVAISSLGAPFALLLSQPQDVIRSNGTKIPYMKKTSLAIEARAIWKQLKNKYILLLIPVFLAGQFGTTYQGNYLTSMKFPIPFQGEIFSNHNISILHRSFQSTRFVPHSCCWRIGQYNHGSCS